VNTEQDRHASLQGSSAIVIGLPDIEQIDALLNKYDNVAEDFDVGGDSDVLGFVNLGVGSNGDQSADDTLYEASVSATGSTFELSISQKQTLVLHLRSSLAIQRLISQPYRCLQARGCLFLRMGY